MTEITTTTKNRVERINEILDDMVRYIEEKEDLTKDMDDIFHLLIPGGGHRILPLGDWGHSPDLEGEITEWLADQEELQPQLRKVLMDGESMVWVHAKHMLDDHWKLSVFNIVFHEEDKEMPEYPEGDAGRNPAMAVARIVGSAGSLAPTWFGSARLT